MTENRILISYNLQFFAKDGPGGEKTEPATSKKLNDVRKEGQVAKSKDIIMAVSLMSLFIIIKIYVGTMGARFISSFKEFYNSFELIVHSSSDGLTVALGASAVKNVFMDVLNITLPIFLIAVVIAILGNVLQQKWMITPKPLTPKFSKLSIISGFKRMFSFRQLFELLKSIAMMIVIGVVVFVTIRKKVGLLLTFYDITLYQALAAVGDIIVDLGIKISAIFLVIGLFIRE